MLGGRSIEASEMAALVVLLMACFWLVCSMYILKYSFSSVNAFILLPCLLFYFILRTGITGVEMRSSW